MSPKELLYIEDTLGHLTQMKAELRQFAGEIEDVELKNFIEGLEKKQETCFCSFYSLLS